MNTVTILFVLFTLSDRAGISAISQEFNDAAACQVAAVHFTTQQLVRTAICFPKTSFPDPLDQLKKGTKK